MTVILTRFLPPEINMTELTSQDDLIDKAARAMRNRWSMQTPPTDENYADARAVARHGLLADPAQIAEVKRLQSELRVALAGAAFGKVAVAERDHARTALESTQDALREMEQKRDAWKVAAGVDYRDLDVSPDEASLLVQQWQGAAQGLVHRAARLEVERDALQARVGAALAVLNREWPNDEDHHDFVNQQVEDARAALEQS